MYHHRPIWFFSKKNKLILSSILTHISFYSINLIHTKIVYYSHLRFSVRQPIARPPNQISKTPRYYKMLQKNINARF